MAVGWYFYFHFYISKLSSLIVRRCCYLHLMKSNLSQDLSRTKHSADDETTKPFQMAPTIKTKHNFFQSVLRRRVNFMFVIQRHTNNFIVHLVLWLFSIACLLFLHFFFFISFGFLYCWCSYDTQAILCVFVCYSIITLMVLR